MRDRMSDVERPGAVAVESYPGGLRSCLEAMLMVADQPEHARDLAHALDVDEHEVHEALTMLQRDYDGDDGSGRPARGFALRHSARGWQLVSRAQFESVVSAFVTDGQTARLSQAAFEALSIIAYRQPVTRAQISSIRGVNSDGVVRALLVRDLIRPDGVDPDSRAERLSTTMLFLEKMGLESLDDLPSLAPFMPTVGSAMQEAGEPR